MNNLPKTRRLMTDKEISEFIYQRFFRCIRPFYSWLKEGENYWFEYVGYGKYMIRSDNNLGKVFEMTVFQLLTCFFPTDCENDLPATLQYAHWLGEKQIHHGRIDTIAKYYRQL